MSRRPEFCERCDNYGGYEVCWVNEWAKMGWSKVQRRKEILQEYKDFDKAELTRVCVTRQDEVKTR